MSDNFANHAKTPAGPYSRAVVVSPHDTNDLDEVCNALYVGDSAKDVAVILADDSTAVTFKIVNPGVLPVRVRRVLATGTTAGANTIVALY